MKKIRISESQYRLLEKFDKELTYYRFYTDVVKFLEMLLHNPADAEPSEVLKTHGVTRPKLINGLIKRGILVRNNKVTELPSEKGKKTSKMLVKFSVLRKNFERNLHRLHIELCECSKPKVTTLLDEEGMAGGMSCGFAMQGGGGNPTAGQYDVPLGTPQRKEFWYKGNKQNKKKKKQ